MPQANATQNSEKATLRNENAVSFARAAFAHNEASHCMRMRMHAEQAKAAAAALNEGNIG